MDAGLALEFIRLGLHQSAFLDRDKLLSYDYLTNVGPRSDGYVKQTTATPTKYRAMLLTRVLAGNAQKLTQADPQLKQPPPGFDSVGLHALEGL